MSASGKRRRGRIENTEFHPESRRYRFLYWLILHLIPPFLRTFYGFRIQGRIDPEDTKEGCVTVCNHVHPFDCVIMGDAFRDYTIQILTLASNLTMPVFGPIIRVMGGIGLPDQLTGWRKVYQRIEKAFAAGQVLLVYPEGELLTGCRQLRKFHPGAFTFAVKYQKPVIPCLIRFYPRYRKNGKRKRDGMELVILPTIRPKEELKGRAAAQDLLIRAQKSMEEARQA